MEFIDWKEERKGKMNAENGTEKQKEREEFLEKLIQ